MKLILFVVSDPDVLHDLKDLSPAQPGHRVVLRPSVEAALLSGDLPAADMVILDRHAVEEVIARSDGSPSDLFRGNIAAMLPGLQRHEMPRLLALGITQIIHARTAFYRQWLRSLVPFRPGTVLL